MLSLLLFGGLLAGVPGCDSLTSPNFNFTDESQLTGEPTRTNLLTAAQGIMIGHRVYMGLASNDYVGQLGVLGRESYNHDNADPRFVSQMLQIGGLDPTAGAFGANFWFEPYTNMKLGAFLLAGVDAASDDPAEGLSPGEKGFVRGFAKTSRALDLLTIVNTRDEICGCPITVPEGTSTDPQPQVGKRAVFDEIVRLLEEAKSDLQGASSSPFLMPSGYDGIPGVVQVGFFKSAEGYLQFNRALLARVLVYMAGEFDSGFYAQALTALSESFISESPAAFGLGVFHSFGTGSGDVTNGYFQAGNSPNVRAHPSIRDDAEMQADGVTPDNRFLTKTREILSRPFQGLCTVDSGTGETCTVDFNLYQSLTVPIPIIRGEELLLLRAEANIALGSFGAAEADINLVRSVSGNLPPVTLTAANALDQLLYEKRYSLLFEGGHRWIDMRRYDKLDELPLDLPNHTVFSAFPIPFDEDNARGN